MTQPNRSQRPVRSRGDAQKLAQLEKGQSARVVQVDGSDDVSRRLLEMGITPGVEIRLLRSAPLGDPLEFELRGYRLSLRRSEANQIEIDVV